MKTVKYLILFFGVLCLCPKMQAQALVDTALVEMARADVEMYDIPQVESLMEPGIVRSRYNTVYPKSWMVKDASLTNGQGSVNFFIVRLQGKQQKNESANTFSDKKTHEGIAKGFEAEYTASSYFRTADGKNVLRVDMRRKKGTREDYVCVYFVQLTSSLMVSSTAVVPASGFPDTDAFQDAVGKYLVLFDAMVKNIARR